MKNTKTTIPITLRKELTADPFYSTCSLYGQHGHQCDGRITWEHAIIVAGKSYQSKWSIIPLCAAGHGVDQFQDNHEMKKELNEWVALSRARPENIYEAFGIITHPLDWNDFEHPNRLDKSWNMFQRRKYLISKYGKYIPKVPTILSNHTPALIGADLCKDLLALKRIAASMDIHITAIESTRMPVPINLMGIECKKI